MMLPRKAEQALFLLTSKGKNLYYCISQEEIHIFATDRNLLYFFLYRAICQDLTTNTVTRNIY